MKFYFSGVETAEEFSMLQEAGVTRLLVDIHQFGNVASWEGALVLDSGAYRRFKSGVPFDRNMLDHYIHFLDEHMRRLDFALNLDIIGDALESEANYLTLCIFHPVIPIWNPMKDSTRLLHRYLDRSEVVALGGCVMPMRDQFEPLLRFLDALCTIYPHRFHGLGFNWLKAIEVLGDRLYSADTSKWLDGARYCTHIFTNTRTQKLSVAPYRSLPEFRGEALPSRRERCVRNARNLETFILVQDLKAQKEKPWGEGGMEELYNVEKARKGETE